MELLKLCLVFAVIIAILRAKKPLFTAILSGAAAAVLLYRIPFRDTAVLTITALTSWSTLSVVLSFYVVTFLQRMLEKRRRLRGAREALDGIFNNRRVNASLTPAIIGLLPSAGAMNICGAMVDSACGDYLTPEDKAFVTSYYRHIPESFLPTFSAILIGLTLSGCSAGSFVLAMLPMVAALFLLGYLFYLRKLPKKVDGQGKLSSKSKRAEFKQFVLSLWTLMMVVGLIIVFNLPVYIVTPLVILMNFFIDRFTIREVLPMVRTAFEPAIIFNTFLIMVFKDIITYTGIIHQLPEVFSRLPVSPFLIFVLIFFAGTIISGSNAIIALCMPMAIAAVPDAGIPLIIAVMCSAYAAMQISPTHICLFVAVEYFHVPIGSLIRRTIPVISCFLLIVLVYCRVLGLIL